MFDFLNDVHQRLRISADRGFRDTADKTSCPDSGENGDEYHRILLEHIIRECWDLLHASPLSADSGWRLPVLGTVQDRSPRLRTVVLRSVNRGHSLLSFHTDLRSPKVRNVREHERVSLLFCDHARSVQLSVTGIARIHTSGGIADNLWQQSNPASLKMYLAPEPPGVPCERPSSNQLPSLQGRLPEWNEIESGRDRFCVIEVHGETFDWLWLSREGNLRVCWNEIDGRIREAVWVTP